jgi:hypothetical protein
MNKYTFIILGIILITGYSCKKSSETVDERSGVGSIYATFGNGDGFFNPEMSTPYGDTIKFIFSTHYPAESNNVIDITKMKLGTNLPVSITLPAELSGVVDLTKKTPITIRMADGSEQKHIVVGVIRKNSEAKIKDFSLPVSNLQGFISEGNKVVGLVPGGMNVTTQKPKLTLSHHATVTPDTSLVQDFSKPVIYTVKAEDGTQAAYTVKQITPQKLASGMRKGSGKLLWSKTLPQLGIENVSSLSTSIAVSGTNLIVNTRNGANRYFDRFSGAYNGVMTMGGIMTASTYMNFYSTSDKAGNILISNLTTAAGQVLYVYKWTGATDAAPVKYIQWTVDFAYQVGRKISVTGDLNGDALIFMSASSSNNTILRWQVIGGVLQSQTPVKIVYPGATKWTALADIISSGTSITDKLYISGSPGNFVCTDGANGTIFGQVDLTASGYGTNHSIDLATFNNAQYLSAISISSLSGFSFLYNVSNPALMSTAPTSASYADVCVYKSDPITSLANGNLTGDVLLKVSDDGYKMILYVLVTNGGVSAYEFDCVDVGKII